MVTKGQTPCGSIYMGYENSQTHRDRKQKSGCQGETGLGHGTLCCSAAMLAPGHTSSRATKCKKNYETENNFMHVQLGQILDPKRHKETKNKKTKNNPPATSEELRTKTGCWELK